MNTILILSSSKSIFESLKIILGQRFDIIFTDQLSSTYDIVSKKPIDIMFIDTHLKDCDGIEALRQLAKIYPNIAYIYIAISPKSSSIEEAQHIGIYSYVVKPFDKEQIHFVVEKALEKVRLQKNIDYLNSQLVLKTKYRSDRDALFDLGKDGLVKDIGSRLHKETLRKLSRAITSISDLERLEFLVVDAMTEIFNMSNAALFIWDEKENKYVLRACVGIEKNLLMNTFFEKGRGIIRWLSENNQILRRSEIELKFDYELGVILKTEFEVLQSSIVIPLSVGGKLIGVLSLGKKVTGREYTDGDAELLMLIANYAAIAINNALTFERISYEKICAESILNNIRCGIVAVNANSKITMINQFAEELLQLSSSELIGIDIQKIGSRLADIILRTLHTYEIYNYHEVTDPLTNITLAVSTSLLKDDESKVIGAIMFFTDLSEIRELKSKIEDLERMEFWSELSARMAHEIKNPLVSIKTFTQLLPERYEEKEFRDNFLEIVGKEIDKINDITEQLILYSKPCKLEFAAMDINSIITDTLTNFKKDLKEKRIKVIRHDSKGFVPVMVDSEQIKRAFNRIIENSIDAMPLNGTLSISVNNISFSELRGRGKVHTICDYIGIKDGDVEAKKTLFVEVEIKDTGRGIPSADLKKIFTPFFSTKIQGTGLGLAVVQKIMQEHKGRIEVESKEGKGTNFRVILPTF